VAIEPDYARNLVERVIQRRGLQGMELKASKLLKHGRGRAAIDDILKEVAKRSRVVLWDKKYALATLIYEYLFEPSLSQGGNTFYSIGFHHYVSSLLYLMFRTKTQAMEQLFADFEAFMGRPDELHLQRLLRASGGSSDANVAALSGPTVDGLHDRWMLDLTFMSLFPLLSHWGEQYDQLVVVCDESKALYAVKDIMTRFVNRQDRAYVATYGTGCKPMLVTPSLAEPICFADSKSCPALQVTDLVAGTMGWLVATQPDKATQPWRELMAESVIIAVFFDPANVDMSSEEACVNAVVLRELVDRTLTGQSLIDGMAEFAEQAALVVKDEHIREEPIFPKLLDAGEFCEWPTLNTRGYPRTLGVPTQSVLQKGYPLAQAHCTAFAYTSGLFVWFAPASEQTTMAACASPRRCADSLGSTA
jgi:hypothetical protein